MISVVVVSKDEPALASTLTALEKQAVALGAEVVVVDASSGRLQSVREAHPTVRWVDFTQPAGVPVTIAHQRNVGVREAVGDVIVFTDAGCLPVDGWLDDLTAPIRDGHELLVAGPARDSGAHASLFDTAPDAADAEYVSESPTVNLAVARRVLEEVGGFDESFEYGSDIDFSWRAADAGFRIRHQPTAVVAHDWGSTRRQARRAYAYGQARARLFVKHAARRGQMLRRDGIYPAFLVGLPFAMLFGFWVYPAILLVPVWRHRREHALRVVALRLCYGAGALSAAAGWRRAAR
jgi:cellulose synthase/poly-beta-1,6-N-acetylglucosamine synthase-like glycosyltransferase